jgi:curved DNA-binding protein CbpA
MVDGPRTPYELLGVEPTATLREIRRAYRRKVVASHRTRVLRLVDHLADLKRAYEMLKDPSRQGRVGTAGEAMQEHRLRRTAPQSSESRQRETQLRSEMARELDDLSRRRAAEAHARNSDGVRSLAREHDEREAAGSRARARRELVSRVINGALVMLLFTAALLAARFVARRF